jgi:hypothetical protein
MRRALCSLQHWSHRPVLSLHSFDRPLVRVRQPAGRAGELWYQACPLSQARTRAARAQSWQQRITRRGARRTQRLSELAELFISSHVLRRSNEAESDETSNDLRQIGLS